MLGVLLLATALRMWQLPTLPPGLWYDEAVNGVDARMVLGGAGLPLYFAANNGREPLFIYLQTLAVALLGYRTFALQFVSAGIGVLTVAAVYACALAIFGPSAHDPRAGARHPRQLSDVGTPPPSAFEPAASHSANKSARPPALIAAAGVTVSFWALSLSRLGLRAVMLPPVSAIAMAFFWRAWTHGRWRDHALAGFWLALALYTYTSARVLPLVPLGFVLVEAVLCATRRGGLASVSGAGRPQEKCFSPAGQRRESRVPGGGRPFASLREGRGRGAGRIIEALWPGWRPRAARLGLLAGVALLATVPLALTALREPDVVLGRPGQVSLWAPPPGGGPAEPLQRLETNALLVARNYYDRGDTNPRQNLPGRPVDDPLLAALFTLGLIVSLLRIREPRCRLVLLWFLIMQVPTLFSTPAPHALRSSGALPPLALLYADGAGWIIERARASGLLRKIAQGFRVLKGAPMAPAALVLAVLLVSGGLTVRDYFFRWAKLPGLGDAFSVGPELAAEETARQLATGGPGLGLALPIELYRSPQMVFAVGPALAADDANPGMGSGSAMGAQNQGSPATSSGQLAAGAPAAWPQSTALILDGAFGPGQPFFLLRGRPGRVVENMVQLPPADQARVLAGLTSPASPTSARTIRAPGGQAGWPEVYSLPPRSLHLQPYQFSNPMDVTFQDGLHLAGYDIQPDVARQPGGPDDFYLTLYWQWGAAADRPALLDTDVYAQLARGDAVWNNANGPVPDDYLLAWPMTSGIQADVRRIDVPAQMPDGKGYFQVGLYQMPHGKIRRVQIVDRQGRPEGDRVDLGPVMIGETAPQADLGGLRPLDVIFGDHIELLGWSSRMDPAQTATLRVDLAWRTLSREPIAYTAFVHLIDGGGNILAQQDQPPAGPANPTSRWVPGETVRSSFSLQLPPHLDPAGCRLSVGLYETISGQRASVQAGAGGTAGELGSTYVLLTPGK
jgi:hypothetical protein